MQQKQPLEDVGLGEGRSRRAFLGCPFWRNWVIAYGLVAMGFTLSGPGWVPWLGYSLMVFGAGVMLAALMHASWERGWGG